MARKKDPQARRVYHWQWQWRDWNTQNIDKATAWEYIVKACEIYQCPPPRTFRVRGKRDKTTYSLYQTGDRAITMCQEHMNTAMILHETAHHITDIRYGDGYQSHGPEFVGVFVDLLADFNIAPRGTLLYSLDVHDIKYTAIKSVARKRRK